MEVIGSIWRHLVSFFGTVFTASALISLAVSLLGRGRYRTGRKAKASENADVSEDAEVSGKAATSDKPDVSREKTRISRRIAVITGASSGLGRSYALSIDKDPGRYNVNEIWLIARREDRLNDLASGLHLPVRFFPMDLTEKESIGILARTLREESGKERDGGEFEVTLLMNCAGYGRFGTSASVGHEEENHMIETNDQAAISVTDITVPYMSRGGRIAEVCSVAAFQPIPGLSAYAASKALLYSYSRALRQELAGKGISVTAVCPYWVKDTEFISVAAGGSHRVPFASKTGSVVRWSLYDIRRNHAVSTPGIVTTLDRIFAGLIPDGILGWIASKCL